MPRRRPLLLSLVLATLAVPSPAGAQVLDVDGAGLLAREVSGDVDGIVEPGDTVELVQRVTSNAGGDVTGLAGRLVSVRADVVVENAFSPFPDIRDGVGESPARPETANTAVPYRFRLPKSDEFRCGDRASFPIALRDDSGRTANVDFSLVTGAEGVPLDLLVQDQDVPIPADGHEVSSDIVVPESVAGTTASVRVKLDRVDHPRVRDLRIELVGPSRKRVELIPANLSVPGEDLEDTWLVPAGGAPFGGAAPYTGTFDAAELAGLGGQALAGRWSLRIDGQATTEGVSGSLDKWSLQLAPATCEPVLTARITRQHAVGTPGQTMALHSSTSTGATGWPVASWAWEVDGAPGATTASTTISAPHPARSGFRRVKLTVGDAFAPPRSDSEELLIPFSNAPTARLAAVAAAPTGTPLTLDASTSFDDDGDSIVEYRWDPEGDGDFDEITDAEPTLDWSYARPGNHLAGVEVVDGYGATGRMTIAVEVQNRAPVSAITAPAWVPLGEPVALDASGSTDPDGTVVKHRWDLDGDGACDDLETSSPTTTVTPSADRTYGVCAVDERPTPGVGPIATAAVRVTRRPLAVITSAATVKPGRPLALASAASADPDPGDTIAAVAWDLDGDGSYETGGATASKSWPGEGVRAVGLRVTDDHGITGTTTKTITVVNLAPVPGLTVTPTTTTPGVPVALDARASIDPDGTVAAYGFDLDGDGSFETPSSGGVASKAFPRPGTFSVGVRVTDSDGRSASLRRDVVVTDPPPAGGGDAGGGVRPLPPAPGAGTGDGADDGAGPATAATFTAALAGTPIQRLRTALTKGIVLRCTSEAAVTCRLTATVARATARRLRLARAPRGDVEVGSATARNGVVRLRLTRTAARRLRRAGRVLVTVRGSARDARGRTVRVARAVLLRR